MPEATDPQLFAEFLEPCPPPNQFITVSDLTTEKRTSLKIYDSLNFRDLNYAATLNPGMAQDLPGHIK